MKVSRGFGGKARKLFRFTKTRLMVGSGGVNEPRAPPSVVADHQQRMDQAPVPVVVDKPLVEIEWEEDTLLPSSGRHSRPPTSSPAQSTQATSLPASPASQTTIPIEEEEDEVDNNHGTVGDGENTQAVQSPGTNTIVNPGEKKEEQSFVNESKEERDDNESTAAQPTCLGAADGLDFGDEEQSIISNEEEGEEYGEKQHLHDHHLDDDCIDNETLLSIQQEPGTIVDQEVGNDHEQEVSPHLPQPPRNVRGGGGARSFAGRKRKFGGNLETDSLAFCGVVAPKNRDSMASCTSILPGQVSLSCKNDVMGEKKKRKRNRSKAKTKDDKDNTTAAELDFNETDENKEPILSSSGNVQQPSSQTSLRKARSFFERLDQQSLALVKKSQTGSNGEGVKSPLPPSLTLHRSQRVLSLRSPGVFQVYQKHAQVAREAGVAPMPLKDFWEQNRKQQQTSKPSLYNGFFQED